MSKEYNPQMAATQVQQAKMQQQQQMLALMLGDQHSKCFEACLGRPGASLSSRETTCLQNCQKRWLDVWKLVKEETGEQLKKTQMQQQNAQQQSQFG